MARIEREGNEIVLHLSFWEKLGALHSSPRIPVGAIAKVEFIDKLWRSEVLRGVRAPGTAIPYVVLLGTLRGFNYRDFVAMKGRGAGVMLTLSEGPFERWIFTIQQPIEEIQALTA